LGGHYLGSYFAPEKYKANGDTFGEEHSRGLQDNIKEELSKINPVRKFERGFKPLPDYFMCFFYLQPYGEGLFSNGVKI
jgi:hypothetical protein